MDLRLCVLKNRFDGRRIKAAATAQLMGDNGMAMAPRVCADSMLVYFTGAFIRADKPANASESDTGLYFFKEHEAVECEKEHEWELDTDMKFLDQDREEHSLHGLWNDYLHNSWWNNQEWEDPFRNGMLQLVI